MKGDIDLLGPIHQPLRVGGWDEGQSFPVAIGYRKSKLNALFRLYLFRFFSYLGYVT